jgi:hypothetical protein
MESQISEHLIKKMDNLNTQLRWKTGHGGELDIM